MGRIRIGLSSWTDRSLLESGKFYPPGVDDAEGRLRYYASRFPDLVEVNSTYYSLPWGHRHLSVAHLCVRWSLSSHEGRSLRPPPALLPHGSL